MRSFVFPLQSVILHDVHAPGLHVQTKVCYSIWQEREHFFSYSVVVVHRVELRALLTGLPLFHCL